jgi:hypothetical protein
LQKSLSQPFAARVFCAECVVVATPEVCDCGDWLFDLDWDEDEKLCDAGGVAAVEVDVAPTADAPATADCVPCADGLGVVELCACASNW